MRKVLLIFILISVLCFSACGDAKMNGRPGLPAEAASDEWESDKQPADSGKTNSTRDVLNHYSNLFIASKVSSNLNLRDAPSKQGTVIGKIAKNAGGELLEDLGDWYHVRSGGIEGYVASKYCVTGKEARALAPSVAVRMVHVTTKCVNVRSGPGKDFGVLTQFGPDDRLPVIEDLAGWYKVRIGDTTGYISKDYAELGWYLTEAVSSGISVKRQKLIRYAEQFIGIPYKLGGTSLDGGGIDCSNFVHECLKNALGIGLDRTSQQLAARGYKVSLSNAKPGDLLFYADQDGKINHVAFYYGNGKIIHAALSIGRVSVSTYNYASEPVLIKNVIGD